MRSTSLSMKEIMDEEEDEEDMRLEEAAELLTDSQPNGKDL